jgi:hypothetical protein
MKLERESDLKCLLLALNKFDVRFNIFTLCNLAVLLIFKYIIALIEACWHQDPNKRPSFQKIVDELRQLSIIYPLQDFGNLALGRVQAPIGQVYIVNTVRVSLLLISVF